MGQSRPQPRDAWERLLRERINLPEGYRLEVFARDLGSPRLLQMTAAGDLIVSGHGNGNIMLVKADGDGDGRSDGQGNLLDRQIETFENRGCENREVARLARGDEIVVNDERLPRSSRPHSACPCEWRESRFDSR